MYLNQSPGRSQKYKYKVYSPGGGDGGETVKAKARERRVFKIGAHVDVEQPRTTYPRTKGPEFFFWPFFQIHMGQCVNIRDTVIR